MTTRGFGPAVLLCLAVAGIAAAEVENWSDAPADWTDGLDLAAFCSAGAWTFDSRGEFVIVSEEPRAPPARMISDDAFFDRYYKAPVHWSLEGPVHEELTTFVIRRGAERVLTMEGFRGDELAVSREFEVVAPREWSPGRKEDVATCAGGKAAMIELRNVRTGCCGGGQEIGRASLAVAGDGALIVRFDDNSRWLFFPTDHKRRYARFAAVRAEERDTASRPAEVVQPVDR